MAEAVRRFPFTTDAASESFGKRLIFGFFAGILIALILLAVFHVFSIVGANIIQFIGGLL
jgi:hypothetical protein